MNDKPLHQFGGNWTEEKLNTLEKYLRSYLEVMKKQTFHLIYIDAFAGTGYRDISQDEDMIQQSLLDDFSDIATEKYLEGSADRALGLTSSFHEYIFIEQKSKYARELERLKGKYPLKKDIIKIIQGDANLELHKICRERDWRGQRAVIFLDPYGMQVEWDTIKVIAETRAIDLWILFPAAIGVNRMLPRHGEINDKWRIRLTCVFGTDEWEDAFYATSPQQNLFDEQLSATKKTADIESIGQYFCKRLRTVFAGVAPHPKPLNRLNGIPLYLLCFAAANEKGASIAVRIASHLLEN